MNKSLKTIKIEDKYAIPFFTKTPISIERGKGVYVWDENGTKYIDFTSGWGVTCIGHAHPIITKALKQQSKKIIQNPNSGFTYSPIRAKLLELLVSILPSNLNKIFFSNSGAEANDACIKLARKTSGKKNIISTIKSFHGRTISTITATGQLDYNKKFNPLMPNHLYVPFNDINETEKIIKDDVAAIILEPIQGEGGVNIPSDDYLEKVSELCQKNNVYLIIDEIQTGFGRTGQMFASENKNIKIDFFTMAKHLAGGFPFGAFAVSEEVSKKIEKGDHGGTYCGNPLGCAVSYEVINYLINHKILENVNKLNLYTFKVLQEWKKEYPDKIADIRGKGLLLALEFTEKDVAEKIETECLTNGLIIQKNHGIRLPNFSCFKHYYK